MRKIFVTVIGAGLLAHGTMAAPPADEIYRNGVVHTLDAQDSIASALAVTAGKIVYVGDDAGSAALIGPKTKVTDLGGKNVMPGLVDGHMHPLSGGLSLLKCSLHYDALTILQLQTRIQACLDKTPKAKADEWLEVVDWFQEAMLPTGIKATHAALDSLKTARPIMVRSSFGHSTLLNQRGLDVAKITAATPNPLGGEIAHDEKGRPTGILEDTAQALAAAKLPPPTAAQKLAAAKAALEAMRKQGVTSFLDAVAPPDEIAAFLAAEQQGQLTARAHFAPLILPAEGPDTDRAVARMVAIRRKFDQGALTAEPSITVRNVKLFLDGVIAGPAFTGAMLAPYWVNKGSESAPDWAPGPSSGPAVYFPPAILTTLLLKLAEAGFDPHLHADGDGAVHAALDAIETMRVTFPTDDIRPAIAHDEIVDPVDYPRFAKLNALPVLSFQWEKPAPDTIGGLKQPMGPTRFAILEPAGRLAAAGVRIAYGSDWPVDPLNEWFAVKVGVTRTNAPEAGPAYEGRLGDDPGLTVAAAIRAITVNAAYELHEDGVTGTLETGKFADFIVIDRDPWTIPGEEIAAVQVLRTVVGGRTVYQGG